MNNTSNQKVYQRITLQTLNGGVLNLGPFNPSDWSVYYFIKDGKPYTRLEWSDPEESIIKSGNTLEFGSDSKYTCILLKGEKTKELVEKILAKENR